MIDTGAPGFSVLGIGTFRTSVEAYRVLWESINGPGSWALNPFVWVVEFEPILGDASDAHPILFSAPMVRALLAGTKTQTRRVVEPRWVVETEPREKDTPFRVHRPTCAEHQRLRPEFPCDLTGEGEALTCGGHELLFTGEAKRSPFGSRGDPLYVKETFRPEGKGFRYRADEQFREVA